MTEPAARYVSPLKAEAAEIRAARGAALLDAVKPGWAAVLPRPEDLDLGDPWNCVLGQVYGHYSAGLQAAGIGRFAYQVLAHGFAPHSSWVQPYDNAQLTRAWLTEVTNRTTL